MKIIVTGSLGNIGKPLAQKLVAQGHSVVVVSSKSSRKAAIEALGAEAAVGSVQDVSFLVETFRGAAAVFAMTPPNLTGSKVIEETVKAGRAFAEAITAAGVKRLVMLSSIGADLPAGTGPITGLHHIEELYKRLNGVAVTFLRAGYFYTNYYNDVPLIKSGGIIGANYAADTVLPLVHPGDIAAAAAEELQKSSDGGVNIRYVVSDTRKAGDLAKVLGAAVNKPDLPWVEFTDEQSLQGMLNAGLPEEMAGLYTEMGAGFRSGRIAADFQKSGAPVEGAIKLEDFAKDFAVRFRADVLS